MMSFVPIHCVKEKLFLNQKKLSKNIKFRDTSEVLPLLSVTRQVDYELFALCLLPSRTEQKNSTDQPVVQNSFHCNSANRTDS